MITYFDTSTLVKLIVDEPGSRDAEQIWMASDALVAVDLIRVEACAAIATALRQRRVTPAQHRAASSNLGRLLDQMNLVSVGADLMAIACSLAKDRSLRAYDAVHLAGALLVGAQVFSSADDALCRAALAEGLAIANPAG